MKIYYAAFDAFPTSKGASTHILHTLEGLSHFAENIQVFCLDGYQNYTLPSSKIFLNSYHYAENSGNYLSRAYLFTEKVFQNMDLEKRSGIAQFRDIWGGLAMINRPNIKTIFEVNALTSIELPLRFPLLTPKLLSELKEIEKTCLNSCDAIVTPSYVTKDFIISEYGIVGEKITVIPNGANLPTKFTRVENLPRNYILYFGALQPWQGLDILLKTFKYLQDYPDLKLVICSSVKEKATKDYQKLVEHLGLKDKVLFLYELEKENLQYVISQAKASVAPLKFGDRNVTQGCCPIKIIETIASKIPLIVADLPVTRELVNDDQAWFFYPEDCLDLSRCIRFVLDNPEVAEKKAEKAFDHFEQNLTWEKHNEKLSLVYHQLEKEL